MRHHGRMFLLASVILLGCLPPSAARAAQAGASVALSNEAATRAAAVSPPTISAPVTASASTGQSLTLTATATDPDAADLLTITASGAPAGLVFDHAPSVSPATATLSGTMGLGDVGSWMIQWQVSDGTFTASATTALTVGVNHPPVIVAPASESLPAANDLSFPVLVSDPDGDPINSITYDTLPAGATLSVNTFRTSGDFDWTPAPTQVGTYTINWTVSSGAPPLSSSATTTIEVLPAQFPPVLTFPARVTGTANHLVTFTASVSDPNGKPIADFIATGAVNTPLPPGAVWTVNANNTSGTFTWTPTAPTTTDIYLNACDAPPFPQCTAPKSFFTKVVVNPDRAPVVTAPATVTGAEGAALTVMVTAADPDGDAISSLTTSPLPLGATFTSNGAHTAGTLAWTPGYNQAGTYTVTFTAANILTGSATSTITVADVNRAAAANAGGPYTGIAGSPVMFDGSGSSDPDGNALTYAWDFGDGGSGTGDKPSHTYAAGGLYSVTLTVTDNGAPPLGVSAGTTASITSVFDTRVFTTSQFKSIKLQSGKAEWCAQVEPVNNDFSVSDVVLSTVVFRYGGQEIHAIAGKTSIVGDSDKNGVPDLEACFSKDDLRTLFAGLPNGHNTVTVTIEGSLMNGALIRGSTNVDAVVTGGQLLASVAPNPFNPEATLRFVTRKAGALRVRLYDVSGRLVRTLADEASASPGNHELHIDGRADDGSHLSSGAYFFRIEAADGQETGRVSILK